MLLSIPRKQKIGLLRNSVLKSILCIFLGCQRRKGADENSPVLMPITRTCAVLKKVLRTDSLCVQNKGGRGGSVRSSLTCGKYTGPKLYFSTVVTVLENTHAYHRLNCLSLSCTIKISKKKNRKRNRIVETSMGSPYHLLSIWPFALLFPLPSPHRKQSSVRFAEKFAFKE